jgi:hypothetical protein
MSFPSIPTPTTDTDSLQKTCMALKTAVEQIIGTRGGEHMPCIFVQATTPTEIDDGDFWLCNASKTTLSIAVNGKWLPVGTLV